jgi:hypothetical protein
MKYLCLGYYDAEKFAQLSAEEMEEMGRECAPHDAALNRSGKLVVSASLAERKPVVIRPRRGRPGSGLGPNVSDGPYSEAKELIGSFFIVEADDMDEAVRVASLHPAANWGEHLGWAIEVRPIEVYQE